ncbi:DUF917 domain-containing protein [Nakamurella sp. DB0629]|uniref:DUF917 domain-containing protein n=1 Tax=Nakamurella aerolata TaxID=1656892 RepID=A0A849ACE7_9ACTN|nr:DUF917 domain-containing protein [Nakamurella aerolata]
MTEDEVTEDDVELIAKGAAVLGAGGGGDPYIGMLMAQQTLRARGPVPLVHPRDLSDDAVVFPVAMMGAPTVMVEKLPTTEQFAEAITALSRYVGKRVTHVACAEAGGINSTIPVIAAAELGLPLVDGDLMGRAFPELQMVLPTLAGIAGTPMSIADEKGNTGILSSVDNPWSERMARALTIEMGCSAIISNFVMDGATFRAASVPGTLGVCRQLGRAIVQARSAHRSAVDAVVDVLNGRLVYTGKVTDVARRTATGFARGTATVAPLTGQGDTLTLEFQNEHLLAARQHSGGQHIEVSTPDLIIVLDAETGDPITTEALRFGQRVSVLGAPCDERWHTEAGVALVGPRYFGYDSDPVRAVRQQQEMVG